MKKTATLDRRDKEGHGDDGPKENVSKGSFVQIGTAAPLSHTAISPNRKSGSTSGGEQ